MGIGISPREASFAPYALLGATVNWPRSARSSRWWLVGTGCQSERFSVIGRKSRGTSPRRDKFGGGERESDYALSGSPFFPLSLLPFSSFFLCLFVMRATRYGRVVHPSGRALLPVVIIAGAPYIMAQRDANETAARNGRPAA